MEACRESWFCSTDYPSLRYKRRKKAETHEITQPSDFVGTLEQHKPKDQIHARLNPISCGAYISVSLEWRLNFLSVLPSNKKSLHVPRCLILVMTSDPKVDVTHDFTLHSTL